MPDQKSRKNAPKLPGYLDVAEEFTIDNGRWYDDSELHAMHTLLRNRAAEARKHRGMHRRKQSAYSDGP